MTAVSAPSLVLGTRRVVAIFMAFAFAYLLSAMLRAVTATLAPVFSAELSLRSSELGLLAGAYFLGFAVMQLPLGAALDRFGPRRVVLALLVVASLGCAAFALARGLAELVAARALIGVGVSACLMAPLTCYRRILAPELQLRANSWMLMTGSLGMVVSTVPVQAMLPHIGWRGVFLASAAALALAMLAVALLVPRDPGFAPRDAGAGEGYAGILRHPLFLRMAPLGFFSYGGMIAVQALWAGPWLTRVSGWTADAASRGLLAINLSMLVAFFAWGVAVPRLARRGVHAVGLITWGLPASLLVLAAIVALGTAASAAHWIVWCLASTVVTLSQPAIGQAFALNQVGRALSAFNLVIFAGVFAMQWGIGAVIDGLAQAGLEIGDAFRVTFALYLGACLLAYLWFLTCPRPVVDNGPTGP